MPALKRRVRSARMLLCCCLFLMESEKVPSAFTIAKKLCQHTDREWQGMRSLELRQGSLLSEKSVSTALTTWAQGDIKLSVTALDLLQNILLSATKCCLCQARNQHFAPRVGGCHPMIMWCVFTRRIIFLYSVFMLTLPVVISCLFLESKHGLNLYLTSR